MHRLRQGILLSAIAVLPGLCAAQQPPVSDTISISSEVASTWQENGTNVIAFSSPVQIELDSAKMSADGAVIWVSNPRGIVPDSRYVEIALIGNATLEHGTARRTGDRLFVTAQVRGSIRMDTRERLTQDASDSELFDVASALRDQIGFSLRTETGQWRMPRPSPFVEQPQVRRIPTTPAEPVQTQVNLQVEKGYRIRLPDETIAVVVDQGLKVTIRTGEGQLTHLSAQRGVVFTTLKDISAEEEMESGSRFHDSIEAVYLEGDVRIVTIPKDGSRPDSRLEANEAFYEVATDRAVLTNAVMHTIDPGSQVPIVVRASTLKQLSKEPDRAEYRVRNTTLTTSSFLTPSYSIAAEKAYVRQVDRGDWFGTRTSFSSTHNTLRLFGVPVLWLPYVGGTITERGFPLRGVEIGSNGSFGFFTKTEWGLFESMGRVPPRDVDASFNVDYLSKRGPAFGIDANYRGSSISDTTGEPESYFGKLRSYFVYDEGEDDLGGNRRDVNPPDFMRGRLRWEHQQFLPDNWQVQLRTSWISDATFLEEYFPSEFRSIEPQETSAYIKRQWNTEAVYLLVSTQPNDLVTSHEFAQENYEIERMPEIGYQRIGDDLGSQSLTFYSGFSISRLKYDFSDYTYDEMGYRRTPNVSPYYGAFPGGLPSTGYTGTTDDAVIRADLRQEIALPFTIEQFRVQPYIMGRYTGYDDSPDGQTIHRGLAGAGVRMTTAFWHTIDGIESEMWDIHRMRHVIEPELHLFASASGTQRDEVYIFDEQVDAIEDITAMQVAIRQRWQTKRGGPGNWQNVDVLTWNLEANFLGRKPDEAFLRPTGFRGLFFPSMPETSVPRDSVNSEQIWRISDSTALMADQQYNLEESEFATASIGFAARRGQRITYYVGTRYINELDSNIASFVINYELSTRYSLGMSQSYDFGDSEKVTSRFSAVRRFDRFFITVGVTTDDRSDDTGIFFNLRPNYAPSGVSSANLSSIFGN